MMSGIPLIGGAEGICGDAPGPIIQTHGAKHRGAAPASDHSLRQRRLLASWEAASLTADETTSGTVPSSTIFVARSTLQQVRTASKRMAERGAAASCGVYATATTVFVQCGASVQV